MSDQKTISVDYIEKVQEMQEQSILKKNKKTYTITRIKYSPTRRKSRNFLSNISFDNLSKSDFHILDIYVLLVKNLNPFSLIRKITDKTKREIVYMLWRVCIPT